ncbi:hypothetical protein AURDEDRAFT_165806 [Auricularia subglabra TFB-10046 SS5]|nr:hypothetical protein AURDEDRAFT_165806 [Auricularia subglabra TFB-10046 SS5]
MGFNTPVSLPRTDSDARGELRVLEYQVSDVTCVQEPPHAMHSVLIAPRGDSRLVPHSLVLSSRVSNVRIDAANADISQLVGAQRSMNNAHNSAVPMPSLIQIALDGEPAQDTGELPTGLTAPSLGELLIDVKRCESRLVPGANGELIPHDHLSNLPVLTAAHQCEIITLGDQHSPCPAEHQLNMASLLRPIGSTPRSAYSDLLPNPAAAPSSSQKQHSKFLAQLRIALECNIVVDSVTDDSQAIDNAMTISGRCRLGCGAQNCLVAPRELADVADSAHERKRSVEASRVRDYSHGSGLEICAKHDGIPDAARNGVNNHFALSHCVASGPLIVQSNSALLQASVHVALLASHPLFIPPQSPVRT